MRISSHRSSRFAIHPQSSLAPGTLPPSSCSSSVRKSVRLEPTRSYLLGSISMSGRRRTSYKNSTIHGRISLSNYRCIIHHKQLPVQFVYIFRLLQLYNVTSIHGPHLRISSEQHYTRTIQRTLRQRPRSACKVTCRFIMATISHSLLFRWQRNTRRDIGTGRLGLIGCPNVQG